jgi:hypothetical protein
MRCSVSSLTPIRCINCTYWMLSKCIASMNAAWACCAAFGSIWCSLLLCVYYSRVGCCCQAAIKTFSSCSKKKVMLSSPLLYPQRKRTPPSLVSSTESMMTFCRGLRYASVMPALSAVALMLRVLTSQVQRSGVYWLHTTQRIVDPNILPLRRVELPLLPC